MCTWTFGNISKQDAPTEMITKPFEWKATGKMPKYVFHCWWSIYFSLYLLRTVLEDNLCCFFCYAIYLVFESHLFYLKTMVTGNFYPEIFLQSSFWYHMNIFFYAIMYHSMSAYMNNCSSRNLAGDWSCRVHESAARNSKRCWSAVGFDNWELLA